MPTASSPVPPFFYILLAPGTRKVIRLPLQSISIAFAYYIVNIISLTYKNICGEIGRYQ